jgi:hypothetical protein
MIKHALFVPLEAKPGKEKAIGLFADIETAEGEPLRVNPDLETES